MEDFGTLFDTAWYLARNPDVAGTGQDPLRHYLQYGIAERRNPNPLFDTNWYLAQNLPAGGTVANDMSRASLAERRITTLAQEMDEVRRRLGVAESECERLRASTSWRLTYPLRWAAIRLPAGLHRQLRRVLKAAWWAATPWGTRKRMQWLRQRTAARSDAVATPPTAAEPEPSAARCQVGQNPLAHYISAGAAEALDPHPLFDTAWYLACNPDVAATGINPLAHFLTIGAGQGRAPHPTFDADWSRMEMVEPQIIIPDPSRASRRYSPVVSVIIPVFNKAPFLRDCLRSVLAQSLTDIEIICVDDGSEDESRAILEHMADGDPRVFVVRNVRHSGPGPSRNAGIQLARGKYIQFTDADDILPIDALRTLYDLATADRVRLVRGSLKSFRERPDTAGVDVSGTYRQMCPETHRAAFETVSHLRVPWWHTTYLIDLAFLYEIKAWYPNLSTGEDPVFIATLLAHAGRISTTAQITYLHRFEEVPRRTTLMDALDFVRHGAMVRRLWLEHCPQCWREGYRNFLLAVMDELYLQPERRHKLEQNVIKLAMERANLGHYLPLRIRQPSPEASKPRTIYDDVGTPDYWDRFFARPDPWDHSGIYETTKRKYIARLIVAGESKRALELACAEGHFSDLLAERVETLVASDISEVALERAARRCTRHTNIRFRKHDLVRDPIAGEFDLIVCSEVLYYLGTIDRLRTTLDQLIRALTPDGILILVHSNLVSDDPDETGFDWQGHAFGAKTIGDVVLDSEDMMLEREIRTPLYRIQRFRRGQSAASSSPSTVEDLPLPLPLDRKLERGIVWGGAIVTRDEALRRERASSIPILMYHRIADSGPSALAPYRTHPRDFEQQIRWLRRRGYYSVSIDQWTDAMRTNTPMPGRPIVFTFDDGYRDFADNAWPILDRHGFSALIFLVAGKVGGVADWDASYGVAAPLLDWDDVRKLASEGVDFGSHTLNHRILDAISADQIREECAGSRTLLEGKLGRPIAAFSYPWGIYNEGIRRIVCDSGYRVTMAGHGRFSRLADDPFALPRLEVLGSFSLRDFERLLDNQTSRTA
jgi:glycosyltransferase involved in cell wall biosynthesis/peptidoglycan/xylan/chitin deacetylase (PgdA/CDA1 family)